MKLYGYFRSSAAFRTRIALNLKGLDYETVVINLQAGDQTSADYLKVNPQGRVPSLETDDGMLFQSPAIIEYLEEKHPEPALLPSDIAGRARVRAIASLIACDIHPLNNLAVLKYLAGPLGQEQEAVNTWYRHWVAEGFQAVEAMMAGDGETGRFCHGDAPGMADINLVPQVFNAQRFECPLDGFPTLMKVFENCMAVEAFDLAQPAKQPEAADLG